MILEPCSSTAYYLNACFPSLEVVVVCNCRVSELDGNISRSEGWAFEILKVVYINDAYYLMSTAEGNLFNHLTHLAVSYQCYFHNLILVLLYNVVFLIRFCFRSSDDILSAHLFWLCRNVGEIHFLVDCSLELFYLFIRRFL